MSTDNKNRGFCSACGAPLTGTAFCGHCGAKVVVTAVHTPVPETTPEVIPAAVAAPVAETVPEQTPATRKFPLVSVILMGIVTLMSLIPLIGNIGNINSQFLITFVLLLLEACCFSMVLAGMIVGKKERNLLVAFGFLMLSLWSLASAVASVFQYLLYGLDIRLLLTLLIESCVNNLLYCFAYALIAATYFAAKPKLSGLKTAVCIVALAVRFLMITVPVIIYGGGDFLGYLINYLLLDVPVFLSVLLYTPYKK
jgi:hypothetical protein